MSEESPTLSMIENELIRIADERLYERVNNAFREVNSLRVLPNASINHPLMLANLRTGIYRKIGKLYQNMTYTEALNVMKEGLINAYKDDYRKAVVREGIEMIINANTRTGKGE